MWPIRAVSSIRVYLLMKYPQGFLCEKMIIMKLRTGLNVIMVARIHCLSGLYLTVISKIHVIKIWNYNLPI
jgi:hypothetical protein